MVNSISFVFPILFVVGFYALLFSHWNINISKLDDLDYRESYKFSFVGLFSLTQILILMGLIGMIVAFIPALVSLVSLLSLGKLIEIFIKYYEYLTYPLALFLIYLGLNDKGMYITLLGCAIAQLSLIGTILLNMDNNTINAESVLICLHLYATIYLAPLTIYYQSQLYGFLTVVSIIGALGFSGICTGLTWVIGFRDNEALVRCLFACGLMIFTFVMSKMNHINPILLDPFTTGINTFASIVFLLALLIISSNIYTSSVSYWGRQFYFILGLSGILVGGHMFNIPRMSPVGNTFAFLYLTSKYGEWIHYCGTKYIWLYVLFTSFLLFQSSLYIQNHPNILSSLF